MDSWSAFTKGEANRGKELMVFDWDKAARIIKENKPKRASAGLKDDWEWTGGDIYVNNDIVPHEDSYTYLASTWAIPELNIDGAIIDCYKMQSQTDNWDAKTYWPDSALLILFEDNLIPVLETPKAIEQ
jgi:hypothetical protein